MRRVILCAIVALMFQTAESQEFKFKGYDYDSSEFSANDSTLTFYPIDETKLKTFRSVREDFVECPVPNYPGRTVSVYIGHGNYNNIKQRISTTIEVEDTLLNQEAFNKKCEYLDFRLTAIDYVRRILADIKAQEGKKLTENNQIILYKEVMNKYGETKSIKEVEKLKVGKYFKAAVPHFEGRLSEEEKELRNFREITDWGNLLSTRIPNTEIMRLALQLGITVPPFIQQEKGLAQDYERKTESLKKKKMKISFKNPVLSDIPVTVHNPMFKGVGYDDWKWMQFMSVEQLEHVQTSFPVETNYYKNEKYPDYEFHWVEYGNKPQWYAIDNAKNLVGVQHKGIDTDSLFNALLLYDYEHNAYNIQSESKGTQEWALYLIRKRGSKGTDNIEMAQLGLFLGAGMLIQEAQSVENLYARKRITKAEYNRRIAALKKKSATLKQNANKVTSKLPSAEEQERAEKYVKQLVSDNTDIHLSNMNAERLNGTQMVVCSDDCRVQALLTYTLTNEGKLKRTYRIKDKKNF